MTSRTQPRSRPRAQVNPGILLGGLALMARTSQVGAQELEHGPTAPDSAFPSHQFQLAPRYPERVQLAFHYGLIQPMLFGGFNAAVDLRHGPFVLTYSHGEGLDYSASPELGLEAQEADAGMTLRSPWTTGGGIGVVLMDELYVLLDVKGHRYEAALGGEQVEYTTVSVGGELGWRFFVWHGLFAQPMLRFWPNVWTSLPGGSVELAGVRHEAKNLGAFANVSIGWAFDL